MMGKASLACLAELVDGRLVGDPRTVITGAESITAVTKGQITFADHQKLIPHVENSQAAAVVLPESCGQSRKPSIHVASVRPAFARIVTHFRPPYRVPRIGISPAAVVSSAARIASDVDIYPGAFIGPDVEIDSGATVHANVCIMARCRIGQDVTIFPGSVLYEDTVVGPRVLIHAGAVIGAHGFGYDTVNGQHELSDQLGYVRIGADVEIGACTTIDRATYGATIIGEGTKIDNQVMIAHNCVIGKHNLICSQVGIAGSSTTGDYVVMAGQVGVPDHVRIGHRAVLGAKSGIMRDVPDGTTVIGIPATPERDQMAKQAALAKLPEMRKQLRRLQRVVDDLMNTPEMPTHQ